jgi:uncharacterized protein YukE
MKYYVDMDKLKYDGEDLIHHAQNNIGPKYDEMMSLLKNFEWEGDARNVFDENYKKMIKKIKDIEEVIVKLGAFMVTCSEQYDKTDQQLMVRWQENIDKYSKKTNN